MTHNNSRFFSQNKASKTLDQVQEALCEEIFDLANAPKRLRSLANFPYLNVIK